MDLQDEVPQVGVLVTCRLSRDKWFRGVFRCFILTIILISSRTRDVLLSMPRREGQKVGVFRCFVSTIKLDFRQNERFLVVYAKENRVRRDVGMINIKSRQQTTLKSDFDKVFHFKN